MRALRILLIPMLSYFTTPLYAEDFSEQILYDSILSESYYDTKIELGQKLGLFKTKSSVELLKKLLENPYHWNREAALTGIFASNELQFNKIIIQQFLIDPILRPRIRREFIKKNHFYIKDIIMRYELETNPIYKNLLHNLIAISPNSEEYFRQRIKTNTDNEEKNEEAKK